MPVANIGLSIIWFQRVSVVQFQQARFATTDINAATKSRTTHSQEFLDLICASSH